MSPHPPETLRLARERATAAMLFAGALGLAWTAGLSGCGSKNGDDPDARGEGKYTASDGRFGITFVRPPWSVVEKRPRSLQLEIPAAFFGITLDGAPPTHAMQAGFVDDLSGISEFLGISGVETDTAGLPFDLGDGPLPDIPDFGTLPDLGVDAPDLPDLPEYLINVDVDNPRDVAFAELNYLLDERPTELDHELTSFLTRSGQEGVVYQIVMDPGIFIRAFYFPTSAATVRFVFVSLFSLDTVDVDLMAETIHTDADAMASMGTGAGETNG